MAWEDKGQTGFRVSGQAFLEGSWLLLRKVISALNEVNGLLTLLVTPLMSTPWTPNPKPKP